MIDLDTRVVRARQVRFRMIDDEAVLFAQDSGEILVLDEVGSSIFRAIGDGATAAEIVSELVGVYDVAEATLRRDVAEFLERLLEAKLIGVAE